VALLERGAVIGGGGDVSEARGLQLEGAGTLFRADLADGHGFRALTHPVARDRDREDGNAVGSGRRIGHRPSL
jgi:hypothetical protein